MTDKKLSVEEIVSAIESLTVLELAELVKALEDKFGVSAAAPVAVAAPAAAPAEAQEEKTSFDVVLTGISNKVQTLKLLRDITGMALKEAKQMIDNLPAVIKEGVPKETAEEIKKKFEAVGAKVELK